MLRQHVLCCRGSPLDAPLLAAAPADWPPLRSPRPSLPVLRNSGYEEAHAAVPEVRRYPIIDAIHMNVQNVYLKRIAQGTGEVTGGTRESTIFIKWLASKIISTAVSAVTTTCRCPIEFL